MQEPTHILTGVVIHKSLAGSWHKKTALAFTVVAAFFVPRFFGQALEYHLSSRRPGFSQRVLGKLLSGRFIRHNFFLYVWWQNFKWGILFSMLPDAD